MSSGPAIDPICGRTVDPLRARAVGIFGGVTYYFCSAECKAQYRDPRAAPRPGAPASSDPPAAGPPIAAVAAHKPAASASALPFVIGLLLAALAGVIYWRGSRDEADPASAAPSVAAPPPSTSSPPRPGAGPSPSPAPPPAPPPAPSPSSSSTQLVDLQPPLKLGLRRFVEGERQVLRLLLIDAAGRTEVRELARLEGAATAGAGDAIAPAEEFVSSTARLGVIFQGELGGGEAGLAVKVERVADALVAATRPMGKDDGAWTEQLRVPLEPGASVRAAPFARGRYGGGTTP